MSHDMSNKSLLINNPPSSFILQAGEFPEPSDPSAGHHNFADFEAHSSDFASVDAEIFLAMSQPLPLCLE
jgi:hypothetical protein